jgi:hypothetical protein
MEEFAVLGTLLKPEEFPDIRLTDSKERIDSFAWRDKFNIDEKGIVTPKNPKSMQRLLKGIISYYPGAKDFVPELEYMPPIKVVMTLDQEINYWAKSLQEQASAHPPDEKIRHKDPKRYELLKRLFIVAKKNILTRSASNFYYPKEFVKIRDISKKGGGWIDRETIGDGKLYKLYSTKITAFLINLISHNRQKHVLFTFFKEKAGVNLIKTILSMCGIKSEIFSGDLNDADRKRLLEHFNSENNMRGEKIRVLLVTEAGAEGISVLEARHMHILESSPRMNKTIQAIGRVARFKSHMRLPEEERKVKVWRYWSISSGKNIKIKTTIYLPDGSEDKTEHTIKNKTTVDELLYNKGILILKEIESFLQILQRASITKY